MTILDRMKLLTLAAKDLDEAVKFYEKAKADMEIVNYKFRVLENRELRLEFFREQKAAMKRKLNYWASQNRTQDWRRIEDECSSCGDAIAFYNDAIQAFGGDVDD